MKKNAFFAYLNYLEHLGIQLGLNRVTQILSIYKNPQNKIKSVHIAGTNAKGTTALLISSLLNKKVKRTGLYTSPDTGDIRSRISINNKKITFKELLPLAEDIKQKIESNNIVLTKFEFLTVLAFLYFYNNKVDYAVLETGLGGRLDATNVCRPVLTVITTISKDHADILGRTLKDITYEKAGIIKDNVPLIMGNNSKMIVQYIKYYIRTKKINSDVYCYGKDFYLQSGNIYIRNIKVYKKLKQFELNFLNINLTVALTACFVLKYRYSDDQINKIIRNLKFEGRLEKISNKYDIYIDSSHNIQAINQLITFIKLKKKDKKVIICYSSFKNKEYINIIKKLLKFSDKIYIFKLHHERSIIEKEINYIKNRFSNNKIIYKRNIEKTIKQISRYNLAKCFVIFTGSFEVVKEFRSFYTHTLSSHKKIVTF